MANFKARARSTEEKCAGGTQTDAIAAHTEALIAEANRLTERLRENILELRVQEMRRQLVMARLSRAVCKPATDQQAAPAPSPGAAQVKILEQVVDIEALSRTKPPTIH